ncbi:unnamed protein product, partial [Staurois parvus]
MNGNPLLHCSRPAVYIHGPDRKWLILSHYKEQVCRAGNLKLGKKSWMSL